MSRLFALLFFVILLVAIIISRIRSRQLDIRDDDIEAENAGTVEGNFRDANEYEMENRFYEEVKSGKKICTAARIFSQFDAMFIKSMLQSAGIPFHVESAYMGIGGIRKNRDTIQALVSVLDEDYEDAVLVITEYINTKAKDADLSKTRNVMEGVMRGWYDPPSGGEGIEIIKKASHN